MSNLVRVATVIPSALECGRRVTYEPPYDSPIEDAFAWHATKYLNQQILWTPQFEVMTICGRFRIDFVAEISGRTVGFECDGAEYHDGRRDELRDALILFDSRRLDVIYRLRGTDLHWRMHDVLYLLACFEPALFSERAMLQLPRLASGVVVSQACQRDYRGMLLGYGRGEDRPRGTIEFLHLQRRAADADPRAFRFERKFVSFALAIGGGKLDHVAARWHEHLMDGVA